ncbi:MAG: glycosyltransferase family 2 protein [Acidobacteriota bacterium]
MSSEETRPTIICLTPVKNEAWILDRFLQCASVWADHIVIADQGSEDGSREIASRYSKVALIDNSSTTYSETERQKILLAAARRFPEPRLLIALDADEILTANFMKCPEWNTVLRAAVGTVIYFRWVNLRPDLQSYWSPDSYHAWGFMDDGSEHNGFLMHSPRVPVPADAPRLRLRNIRVLHYQYIKWERMESKHRWYQCLERVNQPSRSAIDIYRQYHHMNAIPPGEIYSMQKDWVSGYEEKGIDMTSVREEATYWWDREVLAMFAQHTPKAFRTEDIWGVNWSGLLKKTNPNDALITYQDPRSPFDKLLHRWLRKTQPIYHKKWVKLVDKTLASFGW